MAHGMARGNAACARSQGVINVAKTKSEAPGRPAVECDSRSATVRRSRNATKSAAKESVYTYAQTGRIGEAKGEAGRNAEPRQVGITGERRRHEARTKRPNATSG